MTAVAPGPRELVVGKGRLQSNAAVVRFETPTAGFAFLGLGSSARWLRHAGPKTDPVTYHP